MRQNQPPHHLRNSSVITSLKASPLRACLSLFSKITSKRSAFLGMLIVFIISAVLISPVQQVNALTATSSLPTTDMAKSFAGYKWLRSCLERGNYQAELFTFNYITQNDANSYNWFFGKTLIGQDNNVSTAGVINDGGDKDGDISCGEAEGDSLIRKLAGLWGYSSGAALLCDLKFTRDVGSDCTSVSSSGTNNFTPPSNPAANLDAIWTSKLGNSSTGVGSIANGGEYSLYLQSFLAKCGTPSTSGEYSIQTFSAGNPAPQVTKYTAKDRDFTKTSGNVRIYQDVGMTCGELENKLNDETDPAVLGYKKYLAANDNTDTGMPAEGCAPGSTDPACAGATTNPTSCAIQQGLGWIICPLTNTIATATDALYGWVQNFLVVQPLNINTGDASNTTYQAWSAMRTVANVAFVIAFLFIIFSQLTSMGVSNYGVKKMLPRLVIAAILVNLSYWICAIAVDISNVLGSNIYSVLRDPAGIKIGDVTYFGNMWENVLGILLAGGAITGVVAGVFAVSAVAGPALIVIMWAAIVFVLVALLAILVAFCILAARQALIIMFIVLSPLAFVAYLLPNTEKFFTTWRKALTTLLLFYPLFSILFGGSYLAGMIIIGSAGQDDQNAAAGMTVLLGMAVMVVPLVLTPLLIKFSTGIMGTVAGMVNNKSRGLVDRAKKVRNRKAGLAMNEAMQHPNNQRNPFSRLYRRVNDSAAGDADRKKAVDSNNQATYMESARGQNLSTIAETAGQRSKAAQDEQKARIDTLKNTAGTANQAYNVRSENAGIDSNASEEEIKQAKAQRILTDPTLATRDNAAREAQIRTGQSEAENQRRFDDHVQNDAGLTGVVQATKRAKETSKTIEGEQDLEFERSKLTNPLLQNLHQRQTDSSVYKAQVEAELDAETSVRQDASAALRGAKLDTAGYKEVSKTIQGEQDLDFEQAKVTDAALGTLQVRQDATKRETELAQARQKLNVEQVAESTPHLQDVALEKANVELETSSITEGGTLRVQQAQQSRVDTMNTMLDVAATKREKAALDKEFEQTVTEGTSEAGGRVLTGAGIDAGVVQRLQESQVQSAVATSATTSAQNVQQQEYAEAITADTMLQAAAGGIDPQGPSRVRAAAEAVTRDVSIKAIAAEKGTMSQMPVVNPIDPRDPAFDPAMPTLESVLIDPGATRERQAAAAGRIVAEGSDTQIHALFDYVSSIQDPETRTLLQQQMSADIGSRWPVSISATDKTAMSQGRYTGNFETKVKSRIQGGHISAAALASASTDELDRMIKSIQTTMASTDPRDDDFKAQAALLKTQVDEYLSNENNTKPPEKIASRMREIAGSVPTPPTTTP